MFIIGKYVKTMVKNRPSPCYFLSSKVKSSKMLQKLNQRDCYYLNSWFHFFFFFFFVAFKTDTSHIQFAKVNFFTPDILNDINHGYRAAILKGNYSWLLPFYIAPATQFYFEKLLRLIYTKLHHTSLNEDFHLALSC